MPRGEGRKTQKRGAFGTAHKLPSGRYRAMYYGPDGRRYKAPTMFLTEKDARGWLSLRQAEIIRKAWTPPEADQAPVPKVTFAKYAETWLLNRQVSGRPLKERTREHYQKLLDDHLIDTFGALPLASITVDDVDAWHAKTLVGKPTMRAHAYSLLRGIMGTAVATRKISANPCVISGAGSSRRVHAIRPATLPELETLTAAMPEQYRAMVLLAAWCGARFGELTELRRKDVVIIAETKDDGEIHKHGVMRIERAVVRTADGFMVTTPKSDAGIRDVWMPPHLMPMIEQHLAKFVGKERDSLLFPAKHGGHLAPATLYRRFYTARSKAGREDLRWHDLRHTGATLAAGPGGANLPELMARGGWSTQAAAMRYLHAAAGRDRVIAEQLSKAVSG
ncbi:tyrosine-type recombinase/integrase [Mycolicibacterium hodleri]|uniref:Site-specific integrase n=1 Tax=Mycolicibacterium hodleri TaxID=49897 RepID=A0A502E249_9MYCO|nr:site-specific integrase [Mycolicibacterium hodleri]TPG31657.1 site-specific integrase [Mycolicibacterium hodleri]